MVIRVGMVGVNTSHATAFATAIGTLPDATLTWVWGGELRPGQPDAAALARTHAIADVVRAPTDLLAETDLVLIIDDTGGGRSHAALARPFLRAGVATFVNKPMALDLAEAVELFGYTTAVTSSSALRFSREIAAAREEITALGTLSSGISTGPGEWFYYGVHAVEQLFAATGGGVAWVQRLTWPQRDVAILGYHDGHTAVVQTLRDAKNSFVLSLHGEHGWLTVETLDATAFYRGQMAATVHMARTGVPPVTAAETLEVLAVLRAGEVSAERGGSRVALAEVMP
ncbi:putative dehydrogenase [Hamadaea flava]|uniref:Gfo/Idh/MocA family protein n=1 Tax=Hamadaea flava TaxID=1742688 RepID=A0ABV8LDY2_9ACTN|nr:Gfo/Idh/MocA family oxidoreductase [Hamadaea flava]MCP2329458.1 putative dehydrogenase [Hamadaea flava]